MDRVAVDQIIIVLAAPRILGLAGTSLSHLPTELLVALRLMITFKSFPRFRYQSIKHAWKMLNPGADGEPGNYEQFRESHGWVKGVRREVEPFKQETSYVLAAEAYDQSVLEGQAAQKKYSLEYPDEFKEYKARIQATRMRNREDPTFQARRQRQREIRNAQLG